MYGQRQYRFLPVLIALMILPVGFAAEKRFEAIWAVNDGEKVERDDLNNPNKRSNSAWDGRKIRLFAARN